MCPSGTGRFIADSWFSDEPLPAAYTAPSAAKVRETGGVGGKTVDRAAVEAYLKEVDLPAAIAGVRKEAEQIGGLRGQYLDGLADCLQTMWDLAMEILGDGPAVPYERSVESSTGRPPEPSKPRSQARARCRAVESCRISTGKQWRLAGSGGRLAARASHPHGIGESSGRRCHRLLRQFERRKPPAALAKGAGRHSARQYRIPSD